MKAYVRVTTQLDAFLSLTLDGHEIQLHASVNLLRQENPALSRKREAEWTTEPVYTFPKKEKLPPFRESNHDFSDSQYLV